jgi:protein arginine N-methyltransferase 1
MNLDEHRLYLSDAARNDAYRRALQRVIRPEHVVLDLGSGTGILGMLACQAGARHVYSVDDSPAMCELARRNAAANHLSARMTFLAEHSSRVTLPEKVDVVVADQLGPFGFEAGLFSSFADACSRLGSQHVACVPSHVRFVCAPADYPAQQETWRLWHDLHAGLSFTPAWEHLAHRPAHATVTQAHLLSDPSSIADHTVGAAPSTSTHTIACAHAFTVTRPGSLNGIAAWFEATLARGIVITNAPEPAPDPATGDATSHDTTEHVRIRRPQAWLPLHHPVAVHAGDVVRLSLFVLTTEVQVHWSVEVRNAQGALTYAQRHSTLHAMYLDASTLRKQLPSHAPRRSPLGDACAWILQQIDGTVPVSTLIARTQQQYPMLFPTQEAAATWVSRLLDMHAE